MDIVVVAIVVVVGIVLWVGSRGRKGRPGPMPQALCAVAFDDRTITVRYPNGDTRAIGWDELTLVGIKTTDEGPFVEDVFWGLHGPDGEPQVVYAQGATGEEELLVEMQRRLVDFDNRQLIEAMGSARNAFFVIWKGGRPDVA